MQPAAEDVAAQRAEHAGPAERVQNDEQHRAEDQAQHTEQLKSGEHADQHGERVQSYAAGQHLRLKHLPGDQNDAIQHQKADRQSQVPGHVRIQRPGEDHDANPEIRHQINDADGQANGEGRVYAQQQQADDYDHRSYGDQHELGTEVAEQRLAQVLPDLRDRPQQRSREEREQLGVMPFPAGAEEEGGQYDHDQNRAEAREEEISPRIMLKNPVISCVMAWPTVSVVLLMLLSIVAW